MAICKGWNFLKSKFRVSKMVKIGIFGLLKSLKLISRKIWMAEKIINFHSVTLYLSSDKRLAKTHPADPAPTTIWLYSEDVEYLFGLILSLQTLCKPWNDKGWDEVSIPEGKNSLISYKITLKNFVLLQTWYSCSKCHVLGSKVVLWLKSMMQVKESYTKYW